MASGSNVTVLEKDADFDGTVLQSPVQVLVDFGATWCGPCKALDPIVNKIADDFQGRLKVVAVDIDNCPEVTKKYGVKSVPTLLAFGGGEKMGQSVGLTSRENILRMFNM